jgi:hypothetical protein
MGSNWENLVPSMTTDRCAIAGLVISMLLLGTATAQDQLLPFRDPSQGQWGYKHPDGSVAIPPRYLGAGVFREGHAPVKDADGFAMIDATGRIAQRIVVDTVSARGVCSFPVSVASRHSSGG